MKEPVIFELLGIRANQNTSQSTQKVSFQPPRPNFPPTIVSHDAPQVSLPSEELVIPTRVGRAPGSTWNTYTDPNIGFSFSHPANWTIAAPAKLPSFEFPPHGYGIILYNYNDVMVEREYNPDEMKIEIKVLPKMDKTQNLPSWISEWKYFNPENMRHKMSSILIDGAEARRWIEQGPTLPQGTIVAAVDQGDYMYVFVASPATSRFAFVFDRILYSFQLP